MDLIECLQSTSFTLTMVIIGLFVGAIVGLTAFNYIPNWIWFRRNWASIRTGFIICLIVFSVGQLAVSTWLISHGY